MLKQKVKEYFQKHDELKVLFFFDPNHEYQEEIDSWDLEKIALIVADEALFNLKYKLEFELNQKKVFLYFTSPQPEGTEKLNFPLIDLLYANKVLQIDDVAEFMEMYELKPYQRPIVKKFISYLKTQKVKKILAPVIKSDNFQELSIKKGLISSFLNFDRIAEETTLIPKLFTLLLNDDDSILNNFVQKVNKIEATDIVCRWLDDYFEISTDSINKPTLLTAVKKLKYSLITQNISRILPDDNYSELKISSPNKINLLNSLMIDWRSDSKISTHIEPIFDELANDVDESRIVKLYGTETEYGLYTNKLIYSILEQVIEFIPYQPEKSAGILGKLKSNIQDHNNEMKQVAEFLSKVSSIYITLNSIKSYIYDNPEDYLEKYTEEYYTIDLNYRKALTLLGDIKHTVAFDSLNIADFLDEVHKKYEAFLKELNTQWLKCLEDHNFEFTSIRTKMQYDFFNDYVKNRDHKIAVIISDALRYEAAYELLTQMHIDPKHQAKIGYMLSSLPSNTKLGMANLLPRNKIEFKKGTFVLDGISIEGMENRAKILQAKESDSKVIGFEELEKLSRTEARDLFKAKIVYIYHNTIDAVGDDRKTEQQTFEAVDKALKQLTPMIKKIHSSYNVTDVLITADHGFLYNYKDIPESMFEQLPDNKNAVVNHNRFTILKKKIATNSYVIDMAKCSIVDNDYKITIPKAINRYKRQGHGMHFVHGGASIQEMVVPVIESSRQREDVAERVTFKLLSSNLKIVSGAIKLKILQEKPIGSTIKSVTLLIGLYNDANELVSNEYEITLDSTSKQPTERIKEVILNLSNKAGKLNFVNLKIFDKEREPNKLNPSVNEKVINQTLIQTDF